MFFKQKPQKGVLNSTLIFKITFDFSFLFFSLIFLGYIFLGNKNRGKLAAKKKKITENLINIIMVFKIILKNGVIKSSQIFKNSI